MKIITQSYEKHLETCELQNIKSWAEMEWN